MNQATKQGQDNVMETILLYKSTIYGIALTRLGNREDADEVFQEVFLIYFKEQRTFNSREHEKAWMIKTTLNFSKRMLDKRKRHQHETLMDVADPILFNEDTYQNLYRALLSLSLEDRTVLYLYYFEGYSVKEIASMIRKRAGTVRMQMTRARGQLKGLLKGDWLDETE